MRRGDLKNLSYLRGEWDRLKLGYENQRQFFNERFDWEEGVSHLLQGPVRLEGETFKKYKERRWVEKNLIRFYKQRGIAGQPFSKYHR